MPEVTVSRSDAQKGLMTLGLCALTSAYGALSVAPFLLLGPLGALLWVLVGVLAALGLRARLRTLPALCLYLGYGLAWITLEVRWRSACQRPCQMAPLATDLPWIASVAALLGLGLLVAGVRRGALSLAVRALFVVVYLLAAASLMRLGWIAHVGGQH